jgi:phage tail-like protein
MPTGERVDPDRGFHVRVQIDNPDVAAYSEPSGRTFDVDPGEYREGTDLPLHVRKLTGLRKFANIALKRGITENQDLWDWYKEVLDGSVERRNGAVILLDEDRNEVLRWNFEGGWICKWEGPSMNATSNDVAIESIEICVERVELE